MRIYSPGIRRTSRDRRKPSKTDQSRLSAVEVSRLPITAGSLVYIVDDDPQVRRLLVEALTGVGHEVEACESGEVFMQVFRPSASACVLLDVRMPKVTGPEVHEWLARLYPQVPVIFLTGFADVSTAVRAMRKGAYDFIEKPFNVQQLIERVHEALKPGAGRVRSPTADTVPPPAWLAELTPRERDVLQGLVAGKRNKMIAAELGISERTVETHRANLMAKSGAKTAAQLISRASGLTS